MSGHSKWHNIKRTKEAGDKKKSLLFTRLTRELQSAARRGSDPKVNAALRDAITRARHANMPQATIDRLLQNKSQARLREVTYEAFGPGGAALLIQAATDNPRRTVAEVRSVLIKHKGNLAGPNSVRWKFNAALQPTFPVPLAEADRRALEALRAELRSIPHITNVYSDSP